MQAEECIRVSISTMRLLHLSATALPVELWTISPSSIASSKGGKERRKEREIDYSTQVGGESTIPCVLR